MCFIPIDLADDNPDLKASSRILVASWLTFVFFVDAVFESNLRAYLVSVDFEPEINNDYDIYNLRKVPRLNISSYFSSLGENKEGLVLGMTPRKQNSFGESMSWSIFSLFSKKIGVHVLEELFANLTVDANPVLAISNICCSFFSISRTVFPNMKELTCDKCDT